MANKSKVWDNASGLALKPAYKARARAGIIAAADWSTRNQIRHSWPRWTADAGRFVYHVHLPSGDIMYSTSWNTARNVQGMLSAWQVTGRKEYLETAEWGLGYVKSLQVFSPEHERVRGAFIEETPVNDHVGPRDGIECTQALMSHYFATKDEISLGRAKAFLDWFVKAVETGLWPCSYIYIIPEWKPLKCSLEGAFCAYAASIPLVQYASVTGEKKYVKMAEYLANLTIDRLQQCDGSLKLPGEMGHHTSAGDTTIYNDDGLGAALIATWTGTGKKKYLDAAVANGDWWISRGENLPTNYAMIPAVMLFMADLIRATGEQRFMDYVNDMAERFFSLQIMRDERPRVSGAFLGEDMASTYRKGSTSGEWISLRCISYGLLSLGKLAAKGAKQWGPSYSGFGF